MRSVIQRVLRARVTVEGDIVGEIPHGVMVLAAIHQDDTMSEVEWMAKKIPSLRIFPDEEGRMNRSLVDAGGSVLLVSQFTLYGDCRKGRRPSFIKSAHPEKAEPMVEDLARLIAAEGVTVQMGRFGADMEVELVNDGPVTLVLDTPTREVDR